MVGGGNDQRPCLSYEVPRMPFRLAQSARFIIESEKKNGDAPGPLGNFVMWLVTERNTGKKEN